jgi:hypothetical protein
MVSMQVAHQCLYKHLFGTCTSLCNVVQHCTTLKSQNVANLTSYVWILKSLLHRNHPMVSYAHYILSAWLEVHLYTSRTWSETMCLLLLYNFDQFVIPMWLWHAWRKFHFVTLARGGLWQGPNFVSQDLLSCHLAVFGWNSWQRHAAGAKTTILCKPIRSKFWRKIPYWDRCDKWSF